MYVANYASMNLKCAVIVDFQIFTLLLKVVGVIQEEVALEYQTDAK